MKNLKTITTAIFIALLMNASTTFAFPAISATANSEKELYTAIEQTIDFPEKGIDLAKSGYVTTNFKVDEDGWLDIKSIKGDKVLKSYVRKQLGHISVQDPELFGKHYEIKIYFDFNE